MIYLDNAATSYPKPQSVADAVYSSIVNGYANPGRSSHKYSQKASEAIQETRENIAGLLRCESENIIFTHNCTDALSCALFGFIKPNDHIITSIYEHNSVLRALENLRQTKKITYDCALPDANGFITPISIDKLKTKKTVMVVVSHISNVCGIANDISSIYKYCKANGLVLCLDAAQSVGNTLVDCTMADIICMPGHKGLLGPMGCGIMYISPSINLTPLRFGGTGSQSESLIQPSFLPDRYESGTLPVTAILGLNAGINEIKSKIQEIHIKEVNLAHQLVKELIRIPNVQLYNKFCNSGVVLFNIQDYDSRIVSAILDKHYDIATRPGFHCAPLIHKYLGTTQQGGVRASIGYYNSSSDIDKLVYAIKDIILNNKLNAEFC